MSLQARKNTDNREQKTAVHSCQRNRGYQKINYPQYNSTFVGAHCVRPKCGIFESLEVPRDLEDF
jgi:hypothetical protein